MVIPLKIPHIESFTDEELVAFCLANPELNIERDENGVLHITTSSTFLLTSSNNSELNTEIGIWNRSTKAGKVIDSNGGFFLPDHSMKAPDVAWIQKERWDALSIKEKKSFPYMTPDFVIELESESDNINDLKQKMAKWIQNGVRLGWLVSPREQQTYVYRPDTSIPQTVRFSEILTGQDVLIGFEVMLETILEV